MSVQQQTPFNTYAGNGVTTVFPFQFKVLAASDLLVFVDGALKTVNVDYTVSGLNLDAGGSITFASAPASGVRVVLLRSMTQQRLTDYQQQGDFNASTVNPDFDNAILLIQDLAAQLGRSLTVPLDELDASTMLPSRANRAGMMLRFDSNGDVEAADAVANPVSASIIGALLYPVTEAENTSGVVPTNVALPAYTRGRYASWADWRLACDQAGAEGVLDQDYTLTSDINLPMRCDFRGFKLAGDFRTMHAYYWRGWVKGWRAKFPCIFGTYACKYTEVDTLEGGGKLLLMGGDGAGANSGCFWNEVTLTMVETTELNADRFDVNFNTFHGGVSRFVHLTGGAGGVGQIHANTFLMVDMSDYGDHSLSPNSGFLQDDEARSKNFIVGCYYENGSNIRGNVDVRNYQGDSGTGLPLLDRRNHLVGTVGLNSRLRNDFIAASVRNLARGGSWDWLDSSGKPVCFSHSGGASVSVQADTTEPGGTGKRWEATFEHAFDQFNVEIEPSGGDATGVVIFYKSAADFVAIESGFGSGTTSHGVEPVSLGGDWKMLRLSCPSSSTAKLGVTLLAYGGTGGAAKVMSLGSVWAGGELAVFHPSKNDEFHSALSADKQMVRVGGVVVQAGNTGELGYTGSSPKEVAITFPEAFDSTLGLSVSLTIEASGDGTTSDNFTKVFVKQGTLDASGFTAVIQFATDFQGILHWMAIGRRSI